jgi:hypothetical protein
MRRAMGISTHTGWAACVVVSGSPREPEIVVNEVIEILGDAERFCFHRAAQMDRAEARKWIPRVKAKAIENARRALAPIAGSGVEICAIVGNDRVAGELDEILAAHPRIHTAEGCFFRDVFREACPVPVRLVAPASLDPSTVGKIASPPWGRDQKLAALAAWSLLMAPPGGALHLEQPCAGAVAASSSGRSSPSRRFSSPRGSRSTRS